MAEAPTYSLAQIIALAKGTTNWYEYAKSSAQHGKNNQDDISALSGGGAPGWQAAIDLRWYVADTSSSTTTYTGVTKPSATGSNALFAGYFIIFKPATNNTGASTLNVASSDGAVDIKKITSGAKAALAAGDLDSDTYAELIFDGTDWVLLNPPCTTYSAGDFKLDDLGTPDDNTDLDFSTSAHGLVPKGTNTGNYLKDDGTWAVAGGGWEHILTVDASDVANVDFDSAVATYTMADYNHIVLVLKHVYGNTASQILQLQFSSDDGSSYLDSHQGAVHSFDVDGLIENDGTGTGSGEDQMDVNHGDAFASGANWVNYAFSGVFWQPSNQNASTRNQSMRFDGVYGDGGDDTKYIHGFSYTYATVDAGGIDSFRFKMGSGNITGRFSMYGVKDS